MDHGLIDTIAVGLALAFVLGMVAVRIHMPPLVGYLIAGIIVGPFTPGFVADSGLAQQLAEIGVILLMFGVGIHFSVGDLLAVRRIVIPGATVQIAVATLLGAAVSHLWGWSWGSGIVFGLCLSVASTVVLLRALEDRGLLDSLDGRIAVGWLIVEDLATVLVIVMLPALAFVLGGAVPEGETAPTNLEILETIGLTLAKVTAFVALMYLVGRRVIPWLLQHVARTGSRELFTLSVLACALGIAMGAASLFGVSFALGAFFAGMVINESDLSHEAAANALPLQDAFSVLFFVSVGMLFDPAILVEAPLEVTAVVAIIIVGKSIAALAIVLLLKYPVTTALTISASLAQIGEFSFILAALGLQLGLLTQDAQTMIVGGALISITLNPLVFWGADRAGAWLGRHRELAEKLDGAPPELAELATAVPATLVGHAILVGYGRVGGAIGEELAAQGVPHVVIEHQREIIEDLRERGINGIVGEASWPGVLEEARIGEARLVIITAPDAYQARAIVERAHEAKPGIHTIVRTHSEAERLYLEANGAGVAVLGERALAIEMAMLAVARMRVEPPAAAELPSVAGG